MNEAATDIVLREPVSSDAPAVLAKHAAEIRRLGKRVVADVIEIGRRLTICRDVIGHGDWCGWLNRELGLSSSTTLNFMHAFQLAQSKSTNFADLSLPASALYLLAAPGTPTEVQDKIIARAKGGEAVKIADVKSAIGAQQNLKTASAFKAAAEPKTEAAPDEQSKVQIRYVDILAVWDKAPLEERTKAINSIGLKPLFAALPQDWLPQLEELIAERQQSCTAIVPAIPAEVPDDLSIPEYLPIPEFLRREIHADENDADEILDESHPDEDDDEPELKPRRKLKLIEYKATVAEAVTDAFEALGELASECREIADNALENLQATERIQALENSAIELEDLEAPDVPDSVGALTMKYSIPKRRYLSHQSRANDAVTMLEACLKALADQAAAQELGSELQNVIAAASAASFQECTTRTGKLRHDNHHLLPPAARISFARQAP